MIVGWVTVLLLRGGVEAVILSVDLLQIFGSSVLLLISSLLLGLPRFLPVPLEKLSNFNLKIVSISQQDLIFSLLLLEIETPQSITQHTQPVKVQGRCKLDIFVGFF